MFYMALILISSYLFLLLFVIWFVCVDAWILGVSCLCLLSVDLHFTLAFAGVDWCLVFGGLLFSILVCAVTNLVGWVWFV